METSSSWRCSPGQRDARGRGIRRTARALLVAALTAVGVLAGSASPAGAGHEPPPPDAAPEPALPIIFVHGFSGSGAQYETQALRWASNGYPNVVTAIDRTSAIPAIIYPELDAFIDDVLAQTGDEQVYMLGHSQGTFVMNGYLNSSPARAARVAKYIAIDGAQSATCPGAVPCMGIWARIPFGGLPPDTRVMGDHNVRFPEQGHTQSVTSPESFRAQYRFFTGQEPKTTDVLPEPPGEVTIAGRALNYPANIGIDGATVQLWKVKPSTGGRTTTEPIAEMVVGPDGNFGPWPVNGLHRYELTVIREFEGQDYQQHFYYEPWIRDNHLIRLNLSPFDSALSQRIRADSGPHASVSVVRQKEWWGNNTVDPANVDSLEIGTVSPSRGDQAFQEIINGATAPYTGSTIAVIVFDVDHDQVSHPDVLANLMIPFLAGVDLYMPAIEPPDGTITFDHQQRRTSAPQVINTPNWESASRHGMTVTFREWVQDVDTWPGCQSANPSPCR